MGAVRSRRRGREEQEGSEGEGGRSSYLARRRKTTPRRAARKEAQWSRTNLRGESGGSRVRRQKGKDKIFFVENQVTKNLQISLFKDLVQRDL